MSQVTTILALCLFAAFPLCAETGFFPVAQSSVEATLLIDSRIEDPPSYSGNTGIPTPPQGASVEFQIFMPDVAGARAYGFAVAFQDSAGTFLDRYQITQARTDLRPPPVASAGGTGSYQSLALNAPLGSNGPMRSVLFLTPWTLSQSGLLAVVTLRAKQPVATQEKMVLEARVTVESDTPPDRLIQYRGYAPITWR